MVSNGAFSLAKSEAQRVIVERRQTIGKTAVALDRCRSSSKVDAESALAATKRAKWNAVTNVAFEPWQLSSLDAYEDLRRTHTAP